MSISKPTFRRRIRTFISRTAPLLTLVGLFGLSGVLPASPAEAVPPSAGINNKVNYQGRLLNAAGAVVADGNYNMEFKIYKNGDGLAATDNLCTSLPDCQSTTGTLQWTEDWLNVAGNGVTVKNGYFSVNLGTITTLVGIDLNQPVLWLSTNIAGTPNTTSSCATFATCTPDGEMLPMRRIGSAVYAVNAGSANTCITCILQAPTSTLQNTITPTVNGVNGLTVNATSGAAATAVVLNQAQAADGLVLTTTNSSGIQTSGISVNRNATGGTTISGIKVTSTLGTITNGFQITQTGSGVITNGINFAGTFANLIVAPNFGLSNAGVITLAGAQAADITTLAGTAPTGLVFQPGNNTSATSTGAAFTLQAGNDSGVTAATGGLLTLKGGDSTGGSPVGGGVTIDSGTGTVGGAINIGTTNASIINLNKNTQITGNLTFAVGADRTISVNTQTAANTTGNAVTLQSAAGNGTGSGGAALVQAGNSGAGATGNGGGVTFTAGNAASTSGNGGDITLQPGSSTGSGTPGKVNVAPDRSLNLQYTAGNNNEFSIYSAAGRFVNVDTVGNKVTIGTLGSCSGLSAARLCLNQTTSSGSTNIDNLNNTLVLTGTTAGGIQTGHEIILTDTSSGAGSTVQGLGIDSTSTTNNSSTVNGIVVNNRVQNAGYLINLEVAGSTVSRVTNTGQVAFKPATGNDSTTAFQVQNAAGNQVLTVDTSGNAVVLGKASGLTGQLSFANSGGANLVTLQAGASSAAYALTLPTVGPTTAQCLQSGAVTPGLLTFGACAGGGGANVTLSNLTSPTAINQDLTFATGTNRMITVATAPVSGAGNAITLQGGTGISSGVGSLAGGAISIIGGLAGDGSGAGGAAGGAVNITGGSGATKGAAGAVTITGGAGNVNFGGGSVTIQGGAGFSNGDGAVILTGSKVIVGSATTDATQILLQLDSFSTVADTATCATTTNQGALYYNTATNAIRSCISANWEDVVTTSGLGLILFGIVPDDIASSGTADLAGTAGTSSGPCRVFITTTANIIGWNQCTAYSGGRKVFVAAGTATVSASISVFQNLCVDSSGVAALVGTANATETTSALFPTFSSSAPILCLATIKTATAANKVAAIYDTRVYTTDVKTFATVATALGLGAMVKNNGTALTIGQYAPTAAVTDQITGVVVAYSGFPSTGSVNAVIVTSGPVAVKATAGSLGAIIEWGAAGGYGLTIAAASTATNPYVYAGVAQNPWSSVAAGCAASAICNGSLFTTLTIR